VRIGVRGGAAYVAPLLVHMRELEPDICTYEKVRGLRGMLSEKVDSSYLQCCLALSRPEECLVGIVYSKYS
jgi:hypothetical protein